MKRLRMPAYGNALHERRMAGDHPLECVLEFSDFWPKVPEGSLTPPRLALSPREYRPGVYDFRVVVGMVVTIRCGRGVRTRPLLWLAGELGKHAAYIDIEGHWRHRVSAQLLAFRLGRESGRRAWAPWWPRETERINSERIQLWLKAAQGRLEQETQERRAA
jgi:hypothetical protein